MSLNLGKFLSLEGEDLLAVDLQHLLKCQGPAKHLISCRIHCLKLSPQFQQTQASVVGPVWQNAVTSRKLL